VKAYAAEHNLYRPPEEEEEDEEEEDEDEDEEGSSEAGGSDAEFCRRSEEEKEEEEEEEEKEEEGESSSRAAAASVHAAWLSAEACAAGSDEGCGFVPTEWQWSDVWAHLRHLKWRVANDASGQKTFSPADGSVVLRSVHAVSVSVSLF
jgi:hypothetical protein